MLRVEQPMFLLDFKEEKDIFWPEDGSNNLTLAKPRGVTSKQTFQLILWPLREPETPRVSLYRVLISEFLLSFHPRHADTVPCCYHCDLHDWHVTQPYSEDWRTCWRHIQWKCANRCVRLAQSKQWKLRASSILTGK
jgi:hypothetical protein